MVSKLFIITSTISPRGGDFLYSNTRSHFTSEERFRQTIGTISSIQNTHPNSQIVVLDSSDDYENYKYGISIFPNVDYIPLKELSNTVTETVNTHINKSLCESLMLNTYFTHYKKYVSQFDYITKVSGRYLIFDFYDVFLEQNKEKILFKPPLEYEWNDSWNYDYVDLRKEQFNNKLYQYCAVLYGFGSIHLEKFMHIYESIIHFIKQPNMTHYDLETLMYFLIRPYKDLIIEVPWKVSGWVGVNGKFLYY